MNKQELVELIQKDKDANFESKAAAERALKAVLGSIEQGIKKDGMVQLIGFGTFSIKSRSARKGRNPATGEEIKIKASKSVGFKPSSNLKEVATKARPKKK
ncbi:MAG: HU family DNA-binding protein [Fibrobacterales bacterium]